MSIYAIGDLHLSLNGEKPMDIFPGWQGYVQRLEENWRRLVLPQDTVVLAGDTSWAMTLEGAYRDFRFINELPGKKLLVKGNHDYWWTSRAKMEAFFAKHGFSTLEILHNSAAQAEGLVLCGTRGWLFEKGEPHDQKVLAREAGRLQLSLDAAGKLRGERVVFLHYPPIYGTEISEEILEILQKNRIARCYYGHIHAAGCAHAFNGDYRGIEFRLISSDFLEFCPIKIGRTVEF